MEEKECNSEIFFSPRKISLHFYFNLSGNELSPKNLGGQRSKSARVSMCEQEEVGDNHVSDWLSH